MLAEEFMIKKIIILFFILLNTVAHADNILKVGTYDSFAAEWGPGPDIEDRFEKICNCDLQFIATSQAGSLSSDIFTNGKDVILGVEHNDFDISYNDDLWTYYDYGYFAFIYDSSKLDNPPKSMIDLVNRNDLKIVVQDPRTSPVGMGLLRWMKSIFENEYQSNMKELNKKIITYTPGWTESYGMFLNGNADIVLSYSTSPYYHQEYENESKYQAIIFEEGHLPTKEIVYVRNDSPNKELGQQFINFLLKKQVQEIIAQKNIMYPVNEEAVPERMKSLVKPVAINYVGSLSAGELVEEWLEIVTK
tara:strand:+ start:10 stop:924 length:915 start_codon:yes stop_codon:yes gene_type:complete